MVNKKNISSPPQKELKDQILFLIINIEMGNGSTHVTTKIKEKCSCG